MRICNLRSIIGIIFILSSFDICANQYQVGRDSISIFELMDAVEKHTSCHIYTT